MQEALEIMYGDWERRTQAEQNGGNAKDGMQLAAASARQASKPPATSRVKRNNPGNLRPTRNPDDPWQRQTGVENGFAVFDTAENGLRAMALNLLSCQERGVNTVNGVVANWAPRRDGNDSDRYFRRVAKVLGVRQNEKIDLRDPAVLSQIIPAIIQEEHSARSLFSRRN